ncbi:STAS/SEC14 domain-containing protein [Flavobacteriaceae bacterium W22]|nr:STAS/SEC14 domain-containing protein [Flavobacteriaceae bacterium W22]
MITIINDAPENVAAFCATGEITKEDFENIVIPRVKKKVEQFNELNYLLYLDTDLGNFTAGAWLQDALLGIKNLTRWNRAAIVTDKEGVQNFTEIFSVLMPGEFKSFPKKNLYNALFWCQNGNEVETETSAV